MPKPRKLNPPIEECHFSVHANDETLDGALKYYGTLRDYVQHEDGLINTRLSWSLTVHGFLFAIYGVLLGKVADILLELHKLVQAHQSLESQGLTGVHLMPLSPYQLERTILLLVLFQLPVSAFGAWVGYQSQQAIAAAHKALLHLESIAHEGLFTLQDLGSSIAAGQVPLPKIVSGGSEDIRTGGGPALLSKSSPGRDVSLAFPVWRFVAG